MDLKINQLRNTNPHLHLPLMKKKRKSILRLKFIRLQEEQAKFALEQNLMMIDFRHPVTQLSNNSRMLKKRKRKRSKKKKQISQCSNNKQSLKKLQSELEHHQEVKATLLSEIISFLFVYLHDKSFHLHCINYSFIFQTI